MRLPRIPKLPKIPIDVMILWSIYALLFISVSVAYTMIKEKRLQAEEYCENRHGKLFTDRTGDYICIKEKSIVK